MTDIAASIRDAIKQYGGNDSQAEDAAVVLLDQCATVGGIVTLSATGAALTDPKSKAWLEEHKPHLLPRKYQANDADLAFVGRGNKTVAQKLIGELGKEQADALAREYGKSHALDNKPGVAPQREQQKNTNGNDHKGNPWSKAGWNVTRQGTIVKSLGVEKASALARAVGSHIGATRPSI